MKMIYLCIFLGCTSLMATELASERPTIDSLVKNGKLFPSENIIATADITKSDSFDCRKKLTKKKKKRRSSHEISFPGPSVRRDDFRNHESGLIDDEFPVK